MRWVHAGAVLLSLILLAGCVDSEVVLYVTFLEFEAPQRAAAAPPPAQTAAQAPPDTEIYLAPLKTAGGRIEIGAAQNITNSPGYDNQPSFTADGGILFTSSRGPASAAAPAQTDIYRYDIASRATSRVTQTAESEYSPTLTPDRRRVSVIRVEADGTQRLWSFTPGPPSADFSLVLRDVKPVGYHAWADDHTLALFVLGPPATLQLADTRTGTARIVATDIGRSLQAIPGSGAIRDVSFVQRERDGQNVKLTIKRLKPATGAIETIAPVMDGVAEADTAWTPDGTLLTVARGVLYAWKPGESTSWTEVTSLQRLSLSNVSRLAVSPKGDFIALVGAPR